MFQRTDSGAYIGYVEFLVSNQSLTLTPIKVYIDYGLIDVRISSKTHPSSLPRVAMTKLFLILRLKKHGEKVNATKNV